MNIYKPKYIGLVYMYFMKLLRSIQVALKLFAPAMCNEKLNANTIRRTLVHCTYSLYLTHSQNSILFFLLQPHNFGNVCV